MKPVTQTRTGREGNCFAACLAAILEVPLASIPELGDDEEFLAQVAAFLEPLDLYYVQIPPTDEAVLRMFEVGSVYHTIEGRSPRGGQHAVVGRNGRMVHDPHPHDGTGRGLVRVDCLGLICKRFSHQ